METIEKQITEREDNYVMKTEGTADTAKAENESAAAVPGKFASTEALLAAYLSLEAEFTKRSQRLKELEERNKTQNMPAEGASSGGVDVDELVKTALENGRVREAVISEYLKSLSENRGVPLVTGGVSATAPKIAPKSVKEAGKLAETFLKL